MPEVIVPRTFVPLPAAFESCFTAPTYRMFGLVVAGWLRCVGRRTVTAVAVAVAVASEAVGARHISVFHRFFGRAMWSLDAVGRVVFTLALAWVLADAPLLVLVDDTLARKGGKGISLATMHRDPLLSTARKPFCSFGHVWVVLASTGSGARIEDRPRRRVGPGQGVRQCLAKADPAWSGQHVVELGGDRVRVDHGWKPGLLLNVRETCVSRAARAIAEQQLIGGLMVRADAGIADTSYY